MGTIAPSKMPGKKVIRRKDDPNEVDMYAEGGWINRGADATPPKRMRLNNTSPSLARTGERSAKRRK